MRRRGRLSATLIVGCVAAGIGVVVGLGVGPARAEPGMEALDALNAADVSTRAVAVAAGIDVSSTATYGRASDLVEQPPWPEVTGTVPKGGSIVVHEIAKRDASFYLSVRREPDRRLLGSIGRQPAKGSLWATPSMMSARAASKAVGHGISARTSVVGVRSADLMAYNAEIAVDPVAAGLDLLLPPYSDAYDEGWADVTMTRLPDGTVHIAGQVPKQPSASDGEDLCVRPLVEVFVVNGVVQRSHWIEKCPGEATKEVHASWTDYTPTVKPAPKPTVTAARAFS